MILTREDLRNPMASLLDGCAHYNMRIHTPNKAYGEIILQGLAPVFHAIPSASTTLAAENERIFFRMMRQQARLIDYLDEVDYAVIQGGGGNRKDDACCGEGKKSERTE